MNVFGRNDPCPCGSGRKYKHCCLAVGTSRRASQPDSRSVAQRLDDARRFLAAGHLEQAESIHRQLVIELPNDATVRAALALFLQLAGRAAESIEHYRIALRRRPRDADLQYNLATALGAAGRDDDAASAYRAVLALQPRHAAALVNLGNLLATRGDSEAGARCYEQALAVDPRRTDARYNLAVCLQRQGRTDDAIEQYRRVLVELPRHAEAHYNLGNALRVGGRLEEAMVEFRAALEARPRFREAHNNLGHALLIAGRGAAAVEAFRAALDDAPPDAASYANLGNALDASGQVADAVACYERALALEETDAIKIDLARCVARLPAATADPALRNLLVRALAEAWTRPADLAPIVAKVLLTSSATRPSIELLAGTEAGRSRDASSSAIEALSRDPLLGVLLESAQVCDATLERALTVARRVLLDCANSPVHAASGHAWVSFACAIARQCFINEYVFAFDDDEWARIESLAAAIGGKASIAREDCFALAVVAAYRPLADVFAATPHVAPDAPSYVHALWTQQIEEPARELELRSGIESLTPIDDAVSRKVRAQYEESPYPRWNRVAIATAPESVGSFLRRQFPLARLDPIALDAPEVLVAGCGTGQEAIDFARRFPRSRVLAVDLSLASLAYACRKSGESDVTGVRYAHADLLELGTLERTFDVVSAMGVLHHLEDPLQGARVLARLLRPGGLMRIGLYSATARRDVGAAREFIRLRGFAADGPGIRRARAALREASEPLSQVSKLRDFYTLSECRDLLFHVQEHCFTLPEVVALLDAVGMRFIGFLHEPAVLEAYRRTCPGDPGCTDLDAWHRFESRYPDTFAGMYRFWAQKRTGVGS